MFKNIIIGLLIVLVAILGFNSYKADDTVEVIAAVAERVIQAHAPVVAVLRKPDAVALLARPAVARSEPAVQSRLVERLDAQVITVLPQEGKFRKPVGATAEHAVLHSLEIARAAKRKQIAASCRSKSFPLLQIRLI